MAAKVLNWCCLVKVLKNECTLCKGARVCEHESKMATASVLSRYISRFDQQPVKLYDTRSVIST